MYIPMPFPKCKYCGKTGSQGYHRNCGGKLEIDPNIEEVFCPKCGSKWDIWDTTYYCTCGSKFTSQDVYDAVKDLLLMCKMCVSEIENQQKARAKRIKLSKDSMKEFIMAIVEKIGYVAGVAVGTIVETVLRFFFE